MNLIFLRKMSRNATLDFSVVVACLGFSGMFWFLFGIVHFSTEFFFVIGVQLTHNVLLVSGV